MYKHIEAIEILLAVNANPYRETRVGLSAYKVAQVMGCKKCIEIFDSKKRDKRSAL